MIVLYERIFITNWTHKGKSLMVHYEGEYKADCTLWKIAMMMHYEGLDLQKKIADDAL